MGCNPALQWHLLFVLMLAWTTADSYVAQRLLIRRGGDIESCVPISRQFRQRYEDTSCFLHRKLLNCWKNV
jgi:hypothetical protein